MFNKGDKLRIKNPSKEKEDLADDNENPVNVALGAIAESEIQNFDLE